VGVKVGVANFVGVKVGVANFVGVEVGVANFFLGQSTGAWQTFFLGPSGIDETNTF